MGEPTSQTPSTPTPTPTTSPYDFSNPWRLLAESKPYCATNPQNALCGPFFPGDRKWCGLNKTIATVDSICDYVTSNTAWSAATCKQQLHQACPQFTQKDVNLVDCVGDNIHALRMAMGVDEKGRDKIDALTEEEKKRLWRAMNIACSAEIGRFMNLQAPTHQDSDYCESVILTKIFEANAGACPAGARPATPPTTTFPTNNTTTNSPSLSITTGTTTSPSFAASQPPSGPNISSANTTWMWVGIALAIILLVLLMWLLIRK